MSVRALTVGVVLLLAAGSVSAEPASGTVPWVEQARSFLAQQLGAGDGAWQRVEVVPVGQVERVRIPAEASLQPRLVGEARAAKRMCVWVDVVVKGRRVQSLPVWFAVSAYRPVAVATRALVAQEAIDSVDVRFEERDVAAINGKAILAGHDFSAQRMRRPVGAGQALVASDVEARPTVSRHQEIDVRVSAGSVVIDTKGIALAEGRVGQNILVRNPDSQETYYARVIADGKVMAGP